MKDTCSYRGKTQSSNATVLGADLIILSDGTEYIMQNSIITHHWDTTKDKPCSY